MVNYELFTGETSNSPSLLSMLVNKWKPLETILSRKVFPKLFAHCKLSKFQDIYSDLVANQKKFMSLYGTNYHKQIHINDTINFIFT